jgi:hypothetical protein
LRKLKIVPTGTSTCVRSIDSCHSVTWDNVSYRYVGQTSCWARSNLFGKHGSAYKGYKTCAVRIALFRYESPNTKVFFYTTYTYTHACTHAHTRKHTQKTYINISRTTNNVISICAPVIGKLACEQYLLLTYDRKHDVNRHLRVPLP